MNIERQDDDSKQKVTDAIFHFTTFMMMVTMLIVLCVMSILHVLRGDGDVRALPPPVSALLLNSFGYTTSNRQKWRSFKIKQTPYLIILFRSTSAWSF